MKTKLALEGLEGLTRSHGAHGQGQELPGLGLGIANCNCVMVMVMDLNCFVFYRWNFRHGTY